MGHESARWAFTSLRSQISTQSDTTSVSSRGTRVETLMHRASRVCSALFGPTQLPCLLPSLLLFVSSLDKQPLQDYLIIMRVPSEAITQGDGHWVKREGRGGVEPDSADKKRRLKKTKWSERRGKKAGKERARRIMRGRETKAFQRKGVSWNGRLSGDGDHLGNSKIRAAIICTHTGACPHTHTHTHSSTHTAVCLAAQC